MKISQVDGKFEISDNKEAAGLSPLSTAFLHSMHFKNWFKLASTFAIATTFLPHVISTESSSVPVEGSIHSSLDPNLISTLGEVKGERHQFQSHVSRLLKIFANHMYTSDEAFLRELVSNSLDAIRKARDVLLKKAGDSSTLTDAKQFKIVVQADSEKGLLSITDNGIGMTRKELQDFLGTIAKSGTAKFNLEKTKVKIDFPPLISCRILKNSLISSVNLALVSILCS